MRDGEGITRRSFVAGSCAALCMAAGAAPGDSEKGAAYSVAILGDTHYDAEPESVYHSHYDESNKWAKVQHEEFRRNGEMWRERCPRLLNASARVASDKPTKFVLQLGDIIQGDCDDVETHKKMLDDCIRILRAPYPGGLPFLTVIGNHDFRGKGARKAYLEFAEPFISKELRKKVAYPVFSFRTGGDLWVFCDFEIGDLTPVSDAVDSAPDARHVFVVTHGPFTMSGCESSYRWRLGGRQQCEPTRGRLYETLSRRHAIVLSGHTHTTDFYRHENKFGGFTEFTANSVWKNEGLATAKPMYSLPDEYGKSSLAKLTGAKLEDFKKELAFFAPGLREYFHNKAAGHCRLNVSESKVEMEFYPGDATTPARVFRMA